MSDQVRLYNVKWSVIWQKNGRFVRKRFEDDLHAALAKYTELEIQGKEWVTLHSDNVGFEPPRRLTHHPYIAWEIVTRGRRRKKYKKRVTKYRNLMKQYNEKGIWWCSYCVQLRRFKEMDTMRGREVYCPVCQITNYDFHVRRSNPKAVIIEQHKLQRRTRTRARRRRRNRS